MKGGFAVGCAVKKDVNWNEIKAEYIKGGTSYKKLAIKHGVSLRTLTARGRNEGWYSQMLQNCTDIVADIVNESAEYQKKCAVAITKGIAVIAEKIADKLSSDNLNEKDLRLLNGAAATLANCQKAGGIKNETELKYLLAKIENVQADTELTRSKLNKTPQTEERLTFNFVFPETTKDDENDKSAIPCEDS